MAFQKRAFRGWGGFLPDETGQHYQPGNQDNKELADLAHSSSEYIALPTQESFNYLQYVSLVRAEDVLARRIHHRTGHSANLRFATVNQKIAAGITRVEGVAAKGVRLGNWLSLRQAQALLNAGVIWNQSFTAKLQASHFHVVSRQNSESTRQ